MHLLDLAGHVKEGVKQEGLVGFRFNAIGVSDGISMGTRGMRYSLPSREIIADSVETVMGAQWYDACVSVAGCDKNVSGHARLGSRHGRPVLQSAGSCRTTKPQFESCYKTAPPARISPSQMPGVIMGMTRVNRPSLMVYGGTIRAGCSAARPGVPLDIVSAFQAYGEFTAGRVGDAEREDIIRHSCPGPGACGEWERRQPACGVA